MANSAKSSVPERLSSMILKTLPMPIIDRAPLASILVRNALINSPALDFKIEQHLVKKIFKKLAKRQTSGDLRFGSNLWSFLHLALARRLFAENSHRELSVIKTAAAVLVVCVKKRPQLLLWIIHARLLKHALKLRKVDRSSIHDVEILKHLHQTALFRHLGVGLLDQLVL